MIALGTSPREPRPEELIREAFFPLVNEKWVPDYASPDPRKVPGEIQVRDAIAALEGALNALGQRTGEREDAARAWLEGHRDRLSAAIAAFESIGPKLRGPAAIALSERIEVHRAQRAEAERAYRAAESEAEIDATLRGIELVKARGRALDREIEALKTAVKLPALPNLAAIDNARDQTALLEGLARTAKRDPKSAPVVLHTALDQGRDATPDVARLWVCFEGAPASEYLAARWSRYSVPR